MGQLNLLTSNTVIGSVILALGTAIGKLVGTDTDFKEYAPYLNAIALILQAVGIVWTAVGARMAIGKAAKGIVQMHPGTVIGSVIGALALLGPVITPPTVPSTPITLEVDEWYPNFVGDSLKYVIKWTQPPDTATLGPVDSTVYKLLSTKGVTFFGSTGLTTPNTNVRRVKTTFADSLKLAKPVVGDSVTFQITGFILCRKGDCSVPGSAAWKYRRSFAPPPSAPTIQITEF